MSDVKSVHINGDRTHFVSKNAIVRFKRDIKNLKENDVLDSSKYLKNGYTYKCNINNNDYNIEIIKNDIEEVKDNKEDKRKELRQRLRQRLKNFKNCRSGKAKQRMSSLKRCIPKKIFQNYNNLIRCFNFNNTIPPPDDVINDPDKYRTQIGMIIGNVGRVSDDNKANNVVKKYFNSLADYLGIEPVNLKQEDIQKHLQQNNNIDNHIDDDTEDETSDSEEPELVNIDV